MDAADETRAFRRVWAIAAAFGFLLGIGNGGWQVAVESGQVLAGVVRYPPLNPFHVYHLKLWTLASQGSALLLASGLSEIAVSLLLSGLIGLVSFSALSLVVFALTRERRLSLLVPLFIHLTPAPQIGVAYPIWIVGGPHTYGTLGLSFALLVLALLACGRYRPGLALLGLAPAVHASLGAWLWVLAAAAIATGPESRQDLRRHWRFFLLGAGLTAVSLGGQLPYILSIPRPTEDVTPYFDAFIREWDGHRAPVDLRGQGLALSLATGALALLWLRPFRDEVPGAARVLLRALAAGSVLGLPIVAFSFADPAAVSRVLVSLMPARMMNLNVLASMPALLALLGLPRSRGRTMALLALLVGLLPAARSRYVVLLRDGLGVGAPSWPLDRMTAVALAAAALVAAAWWERRRPRAPAPGGRRLADGILWTAPVVAIARIVVRPPQLRDRTNNRLFAELARGQGMVATAGDLQLIQLRTRRPVLLDGGALDALPYAIEAGPEMARILRDVYSIDFFHPPADARRRAMIPLVHNRAAWEARTLDEWKALRRDLDLRQVLTLREWDLDLPALVGNKELLLYEIPE